MIFKTLEKDIGIEVSLNNIRSCCHLIFLSEASVIRSLFNGEQQPVPNAGLTRDELSWMISSWILQ